MTTFALHKAARGFLEILRGQTVGRNPDSFSSEVQPVIEITEFYAGDNKAISASGASVGALAGLDDVLTFTGNIRLHGVGARLTIGAAAATNVTLSCGLRNGTSGERIAICTQFMAQIPAGAVIHIGAPTRPWVLPPSAATAGVGAWSAYARSEGTAAGVDHSLSVRILMDVITGSV